MDLGGLVTNCLFPAPRAAYDEDSFPGELIWLPLALADAADAEPDEAVKFCAAHAAERGSDDAGYSFPCLLLTCGTARFLVLYFHRNAEDLGVCRRFCDSLREGLGVHVLAVEYPGYGPSPSGKPSAEQAHRHCAAAFAFARSVLRWPLDNILLFGCSLGTGLATSLAARHKVGGLVLFSPFLSVREAAADVFGSLVASFLPNSLPNAELARHIQSPTLIVHGEQDTVVPCRHGKLLFSLLAARKALVLAPDVDHNTCPLRNEWVLRRPMQTFFHLPDYGLDYMAVPTRVFSRPHRWESARQHLELMLLEAPGPTPACSPVVPGVTVLGWSDVKHNEKQSEAVPRPPGETPELLPSNSRIGEPEGVAKALQHMPERSPRSRNIGVFTNAHEVECCHSI